MPTKEFSPEEIDLIRQQFFPPSGTPAELQTCLAVARELGLNPILKEIHFMPRRQRQGDQWLTRIEPLVGRDGFLSIAHRTSQLAGMESTAQVQPTPRLTEGGWESVPDLVAECRVWRKDAEQPFVVRVSFGEYVQKGNDGQPTRFWAEKPETMLKKVAESQALRKAFNIHGVYAPEEIGLGIETAGGIIPDPETIQPIAPAGRKRSDPPKEAVKAGAPTLPVVPASTVSPPHDPLQPVIAACKAKGVPVEMKGTNLFARSYAQRDFLKAQGFRWDGQQRGWVFAGQADAA